MAQTTTALSFVDCEVECSTNNSDWTDISGSTNEVIVSGGERASGAAYTFDGDVPIIKAGKRGPLTVTINGVYSETAGELYALHQTAYETAGSGNFYVRWSPLGGDTTESQYSTGLCIVKNPPYPSGDGASGAPVIHSLVVETASITKAAHA